jgi:Gas vesicle protein
VADAPDYRLQNRRHLEKRQVGSDLQSRQGGPANLADILERVLDKGIVIAGDIQINLLDIELLTIKIRLLVASVDRAKEMGINWWETDPTLTRGASELEEENRQLRERLERLEQAMGLPAGDSDAASRELPAAERGQEPREQGGKSPDAERPEEPAGGRMHEGTPSARG